MEFTVAIRAQQDAFVEFGFDPGPAPGVSTSRYPEVLPVGVEMVELQGIRTPVVATRSASISHVRQRLQPDGLSSSGDSCFQVLSAIRVRARISHSKNPMRADYSRMLYR
jgi:hypothetical protein